MKGRVDLRHRTIDQNWRVAESMLMKLVSTRFARGASRGESPENSGTGSDDITSPFTWEKAR